MKLFLIVFMGLLLMSCKDDKPTTPSPVPTPTTPVEPEPTPAPPPTKPSLKVLDSFSKPQLAKDEDWKTTVDRIIFKNAKTGFIITGDLCLLVGDASRLEPIDIIHASASSYKTGVHYDAITELNTANCSATKYAWLELSDSYNKNGITINLKKLNIAAPDSPSIPLFIQLEPYAFVKGVNKGKYLEEESKSLQALQLLVDHRIQPMKSWVSANADYDTGNYSFKTYVHNFSKGPVNVPESSVVKTYFSKLKSPWYYVMDEPGIDNKAELQKSLTNLKTQSPSVLRMVTTTKDYPATDIDIYCPVFQHIKDRSIYNRLWGYVSCMSHGCGENRDWISDVNKYTHQDFPRSGEPDLVIDAPSDDIFAFYLVAIKLKLEALLYYDSITQWMLASKGVDVFKDMYNFGGNGDGTLLYPDYANKKAMPSLRLKLLREASYLADAIVMSKSESDLTFIKSTTDWTVPSDLHQKIYTKLQGL